MKLDLMPYYPELNTRLVLVFHYLFAFQPSLSHPGRLLYTTGDVAGAVRYFLGLLRGSSLPLRSSTTNGIVTGDDANFSGTDKVFLDDFRVAFAVWLTLEFELSSLIPSDSISSQLPETKSRC